MPTFGWVQEDAWERFLLATERAPEPGRPRQPLFSCPFCTHVFERAADFQAHVVDGHRVSRPIMLIEGNEPTKSFILRRAVRPSDITIANATETQISIDGSPFASVPPKELGRLIARMNTGVSRIQLQNASQRGATPVASAYELFFRVASAEALHGAEAAFDERINVEHPTLISVDRFLADTRCQGAAGDYATGLAEYLLGVLVKERPHGEEITSPLERYREHFGAALQKLSPHDRPLPNLLRAVMRFALNDFSGAGTVTGNAVLDVTTAALQGPNARAINTVTTSGAQRRVCPIDHGTSRILALAERLHYEGRWSPVLGDECRQVAVAGTLDIMDQQKAYALWALAAWRLGAKSQAVEPLERISATYPFSTWASECLEAVTT